MIKIIEQLQKIRVFKRIRVDYSMACNDLVTRESTNSVFERNSDTNMVKIVWFMFGLNTFAVHALIFNEISIENASGQIL